MHIEDTTVRLQNDCNPLRVKPSDSMAQTGTQRGADGMKDTAQTSALARIASEAMRQMQEETPIREDKVAQFKGWASDDTKMFSDEAINAIFSRMFAL